MIGWKLLYGGQHWVYLLTVAICHDGPAPGEDGAPECKTSIVVDGVIGLSLEDEVSHGGVLWLSAEGGEDDPGMFDVLPTPVQVVAGHQEDRAGLPVEELLDGVQEELSAHLAPLVTLLYKLDVVRPSDVHTEIVQIFPMKMQQRF